MTFKLADFCLRRLRHNGTIAAEYYDCGIRHALNHFEPAISYGIKTSRSEFPWHVALYRQNSSDERPEYICGGSIIHPRVILTGTAVQRGDSGGGITFPRHTTSHKVQYYLYGIRNVKDFLQIHWI
nr:uncharacterized protein LOC112211527 [Halyomorpha halys]